MRPTPFLTEKIYTNNGQWTTHEGQKFAAGTKFRHVCDDERGMILEEIEGEFRKISGVPRDMVKRIQCMRAPVGHHTGVPSAL